MVIRFTQQQFLNQTVRQSQQRLAEITRLQNQVSTGLRITRPSDDPGVYGKLLSDKAAEGRMQIHLDNIAASRLKLDHSVSELTQVGQLLAKARTLALDGVQSTDRETIANEVAAVLEQVVQVANARDGELGIFGGASSVEKAFLVRRSPDDRALEVEYLGASIPSRVIIAPDQETVDTLYSGEEIFMSTQRTPTAYLGLSGAQAGVGTDSARGRGELLVRHTLTAYAAGAGVVPGPSSPDGDTIIGDWGMHTLEIQTDPVRGRVVRLDGGAWIPFDSGSTDLQVSGPGGSRVFVDLSAVPSGFVGTVDMRADGTLSVDAGLSELPIDFSANQILADAETGAITNVDSSGIRRSGTEAVQYSGTVSVFEALFQLERDLRTADQYSTTEFTNRMNADLRELERVHNHVLSVMGEQAVSLENLDVLEGRTQDIQLSTKTAIGELEDADMTEAILRMQSEQNLLQFTYAAASGMFDVSLLDFLR